MESAENARSCAQQATPIQQIARYLVIHMTKSPKSGPAYKVRNCIRQAGQIFAQGRIQERYRYRNPRYHLNSLFNIEVDLAMNFFIFFNLLEVFTSVPPDPVSTVHCRHWVVFFPRRAMATSDSTPPPGK